MKFKPEDFRMFCDCEFGVTEDEPEFHAPFCRANEIKDSANAKLEEWLRAAPLIYGTDKKAQTWLGINSNTTEHALVNTDEWTIMEKPIEMAKFKTINSWPIKAKAKLVCIEEIKL